MSKDWPLWRMRMTGKIPNCRPRSPISHRMQPARSTLESFLPDPPMQYASCARSRLSQLALRDRGHQCAVRLERHAADVGSGGREQEGADPSELDRVAVAAERDLLARVRLLLLRRDSRHFRAVLI